MALFRCKNIGKTYTDEIKLEASTGYQGGGAVASATYNFAKATCPLIIKLHAQNTLGTASWAGACEIKFSLFKNAFEEVASFSSGNGDKEIDISSLTKGKYYTKMKIDVGFNSCDGTVDRYGYVILKKYKRK